MLSIILNNRKFKRINRLLKANRTLNLKDNILKLKK